MSYPKKISRETILEAAMASIEAHGLAELSMRSLAAQLDVTPNALYRYFASKAELESAMADAGGRLLLNDLEAAVGGMPLPESIRAVAKAYVRFARGKPALYALKMQHCASEGMGHGSHADVWAFVTKLAGDLPTPWDPKDLALSLWAFLHGVVELDRAHLLDSKPAEAAIDVGLGVMLAGLMVHIKQTAAA